jgi:hypothetical protein
LGGVRRRPGWQRRKSCSLIPSFESAPARSRRWGLPTAGRRCRGDAAPAPRARASFHRSARALVCMPLALSFTVRSASGLSGGGCSPPGCWPALSPPWWDSSTTAGSHRASDAHGDRYHGGGSVARPPRSGPISRRCEFDHPHRHARKRHNSPGCGGLVRRPSRLPPSGGRRRVKLSRQVRTAPAGRRVEDFLRVRAKALTRSRAGAGCSSLLPPSIEGVHAYGRARPISVRNSVRVATEFRKLPSMAEVVIIEFCFSTPRIIMHRC